MVFILMVVNLGGGCGGVGGSGVVVCGRASSIGCY